MKFKMADILDEGDERGREERKRDELKTVANSSESLQMMTRRMINERTQPKSAFGRSWTAGNDGWSYFNWQTEDRFQAMPQA